MRRHNTKNTKMITAAQKKANAAGTKASASATRQRVIGRIKFARDRKHTVVHKGGRHGGLIKTNGELTGTNGCPNGGV